MVTRNILVRNKYDEYPEKIDQEVIKTIADEIPFFFNVNNLSRLVCNITYHMRTGKYEDSFGGIREAIMIELERRGKVDFLIRCGEMLIGER